MHRRPIEIESLVARELENCGLLWIEISIDVNHELAARIEANLSSLWTY